MSEDFDNMPENDDIAENAEALVFAKVVAYIADRLGEQQPDAMPEDLAAMGGLFQELSQAFEHTGGFEFDAEQALPLSHAFAMLESSMRVLAEEAHEGGHSNAAAKMEWCAFQAKGIQAKLEEHHLGASGGIVAFHGALDEDDPDRLGADMPEDIQD